MCRDIAGASGALHREGHDFSAGSGTRGTAVRADGRTGRRNTDRGRLGPCHRVRRRLDPQVPRQCEGQCALGLLERVTNADDMGNAVDDLADAGVVARKIGRVIDLDKKVPNPLLAAFMALAVVEGVSPVAIRCASADSKFVTCCGIRLTSLSSSPQAGRLVDSPLRVQGRTPARRLHPPGEPPRPEPLHRLHEREGGAAQSCSRDARTRGLVESSPPLHSADP